MKFIALLMLFFSSQALGVTEFSLELGAQGCQTKDDIEYCGKTQYKSEIISTDKLKMFTKTFVANEFDIAFEFQVTVIIRPKDNHYICRVFIKDTRNGKNLASYATEVKDLKDLNAIKLGSTQVSVSDTQSYVGWVKLSPITDY